VIAAAAAAAATAAAAGVVRSDGSTSSCTKPGLCAHPIGEPVGLRVIHPASLAREGLLDMSQDTNGPDQTRFTTCWMTWRAVIYQALPSCPPRPIPPPKCTSI